MSALCLSADANWGRTAVVVHRVDDGAGTLEDLSRGEALFVEALEPESVAEHRLIANRVYLVVAAARGRKSNC